MKRLIAALFLVICGMFCVQSTYADRIPTKGKWGQTDVRSIIPAPPTASIENTNLTVEFVHPLSNLTVKVTDNTGAVVYEENISVSTPMPTPLMKIRTTAAGMRTKPFSRRGLGRGSMKRILCATRFGSHGLIGKQQAAHRCSRRNGERPPTKFSTYCAQSRATVSNRLTDSSGHGQLNRAMRGKRCKTTALARP